MTTLPKTAEQIREMPAGIEMVCLVAQIIMGYPNTTKPNSYIAGVFNKSGQPIYDVINIGQGCDVFDEVVFKPSTDIAHAWEVQAALAKMGKHIILFTHEGKECCGIISGMEQGVVSHGHHWVDECSNGGSYADTAALAICRAALMSLVEEKS